MLEVAIQQLQLRDQPFGDLIASPLPPATRAALDELFKRPEVRHVAKKLKLKTSDWVAIKHRMVELIASHDGRKAGLEWQELIDLATSGLNGWCKDPLAASIGALYAVAIWEGAAVDPESKVLDPRSEEHTSELQSHHDIVC